MKRRVFVSLIAFFLFSLVGPLIRLVFPPTSNSGRFATIVDSVVLYIWPTTLLGVGREIAWQTTVDLVVANILFFVLFGLLIGFLARRAWVAAVLYALTCAAVFSIEAWGFKASLGFRTWSALAIIFLLYAIPFWAVRHVPRSSPATSELPT